MRYPTGAVHRVDLPGRLAILGRDPTCDLVLNDPKCSRRHAVLEEDPGGTVIRDTGSANGVVVKGRKVARALLQSGDEVRVGDLVIKLLGDSGEGTLIVGPEELAVVTMPPVAPFAPTIGKPMSAAEVEAHMKRLEAEAAAPPPPAPDARPRRREVSGEIVLQRSKASALAAPVPSEPPAPAIPAAPARRLSTRLMLLIGGAVLAFVLSALLLLTVLVLVPRALRATAGDTRPWWERTIEGVRLSFGDERAVADQLRALAAAQETFRNVCDSGYADLEALLNPSSVFPDYPASGPAFLSDPAFRQQERLGYRFQLGVEDPVPATPSCPFRSYRRYRYSATPVGGGRTLFIGNDGVVRATRAR